MNINDLNNLLEKFPERKRENILELSFALLQWMGIEPNTDVPGFKGEIKPRLLSPQTQKLKEFLFPAPQTVQPQLYRISADNQNIRVRFAVLKKIRKETISQLVDNDPGLTSFQAFSKGLNLSNASGFMPQQPYFIHFVTTPSYDKLVLIFNQGEQKRIVSFKNHLTNTQFHKILEKWLGIGAKPKLEIADLLWKSLDIKEVNKKFYRQIKDKYDSLLCIAKIQTPGFDENVVKQFAVRLIGRYIFCWFLKEKGVIPETLIASETIVKYREIYFQILLTKLFFNTLNGGVADSVRTESITGLDDLYKNIPYLNGGLFEFNAEQDVLFDQLDLNDWLISFVKVLEEFDFTVDESSSQYQQVAIDPEMLGRIFENLLASQNPDTEKMANQRKAYGAFYTPREIVDYMVNESLKAYLETHLMPVLPETSSEVAEPTAVYTGLFESLKTNEVAEPTNRALLADIENKRERMKGKIAKLFAPECSDNPFDKEETILARKALSEITVLDPACGSGAFPMGMLLRLMELRHIVGHGHRNSYDLKEEILSRNIFGVDIMPMAIEIARLRAWLSLVMEADYKPNDRKNNFGIAALPNLDFKFICANSLIDSGYDDFLNKIHYNATLYRLDGEVQKLERIRNDYFDPKGDKQKKLELQNEFLNTKNYIKTEFESLKKSWNLENFLSKVDDWNPFNDSHPSSFFSPAWMFGIREGFNVVIGNPPYVQIQNFSGQHIQKLLEEQRYESFNKTGDIYCLFYERGYQFLKTNGKLAFITSNKWMRAKYGEKLRSFFAANTNPLVLIDFGGYEVFEAATVDANILIFSKTKSYPKNLKACTVGKGFTDKTNIAEYVALNAIELNNLSDESWVVSSNDDYQVKKRIEKIGIPLKDWDISLNYGIKTGYNEAFIIDSIKKDELIAQDPRNAEIFKPILRGRDIKKYKAEFADLWLINSHNGYKDSNGNKVDRIDVEKNYPVIYQHLLNYKDMLEPRADQGYHWSNLRNCAYNKEFEKNKITWGNLALSSQFAYVEAGFYINAPSPLITPANKYILAILNSKIGDYYIRSLGVTRNGGYFEYKPMFVEHVPIPQISAESQLPFEILVDCVLFAKENMMETEAELLKSVIDGMVYDLYFEDEMKQMHCFITSRMTEVLNPFKPGDNEDFKREYIKSLYEFCKTDKVVFHALIHRRTVKEVEIINRTKHE